MISFAQIYKDILGPGLIEVARKHWRLMGFEGEEKIVPPPAGFQPGGGAPMDNQNATAAIAAQAEQNGSGGGPPAVPGARSTGG